VTEWFQERASATLPVTSNVNMVLELRSLVKHFATYQAVNGISLELRENELFALLGPSGCGKTTTLRLIAGFEQPTAGEILLRGTPVASLRPYQRNVSTVFQNYALFPHLTVAQNIAFGLERRDLSRSAIRTRVDQMLSLVQLKGKESRLPQQISGGERQRVALARSLALAPDVLLLDEPLSALDPQLRKQMRAELKNVQRNVGTAFLFITHDQEEALSLADRMTVMHNGRLEQTGSPPELYFRPRSRFVAEFLGEVNWIHGAGVRPENLRVARQAHCADCRMVSAAVHSLTFLGGYNHLHAVLPDGTRCVAQVSASDSSFEPGETIHLCWRPADEIPEFADE
jgi:ABC-type Fe3+/spermidine/putrescine transport system ATPase subunit